MSRRVAVVCDVGPALGSGHAMRCLALAEELLGRGVGVTYVADLASVPWVDARVRGAGCDVVAPPASEDDLVGVVAATGAGTVVVDSYHLRGETYRGLRAVGPTLALVDQHLRGAEADLLLDANIGSEHDPVELPAGTRRLAGLDYALMRREVVALRPPAPRRHEPAPRPRVFGVFGGTDPAGAGPRVAEALLGTGLAFDATLVVPRDDLARSIAALRPGPGQAVRSIGPTDRLPQHVVDSEVVLSASGTSTWELLCLGAATGLACTADNQVIGYERAVAAGVGTALGGTDELAESAVAPLRRLIAEADLRTALSATAWRTVDGRGAARVVDALLALH